MPRRIRKRSFKRRRTSSRWGVNSFKRKRTAYPFNSLVNKTGFIRVPKLSLNANSAEIKTFLVTSSG